MSLVFSDSINGYYAKEISKDLNLKNGESATLTMEVTFNVRTVEGRTMVYFTMKSKEPTEQPDPDCQKALEEAAVIANDIAGNSWNPKETL